MMEAATRRERVRLERIAYHEAGHAVAAALLGCRFGMLSLTADRSNETAHTGPLQIDLWKCAFPTGQPSRVPQVLTILWAGTAAETQLTGRRVAPDTDPDRQTVDRFLDLLRERDVAVAEEWQRRPRLNAHALLRQPKQAAAVAALVAALLDEHLLGHFTARGIINRALAAPPHRAALA